MTGMKVVNGAIWGASLLVVGSMMALSPAKAEPAADPSSIWTLQDENSSITSAKINDKYYVNGLKLGWTSPTDDVPDFLAGIGRSVWGVGQQRLSIDVTQSIYTPINTLASVPDPHDRPYAGVLTVGATLTHDTDSERSVIGMQAGLVGPDALARQVQNGFHSVIGDGNTNGWHFQIHDEPVVEFLGQHIWRLPIAKFGNIETDAVPQIEAGVGNLRVYGLTGSVFRFGQGLDSDFGASRVRPGLTGSDAYVPTRPFGWYVFAGFDGQAVVHDVTIDGNSFRNSASADRMPFVGEFEAGFAILVSGMRISYTQVFQSEEIRHQFGGLHQFGSLTLSAHF
jgi:lipid A 3-O-deacylase